MATNIKHDWSDEVDEDLIENLVSLIKSVIEPANKVETNFNLVMSKSHKKKQIKNKKTIVSNNVLKIGPDWSIQSVRPGTRPVSYPI